MKRSFRFSRLFISSLTALSLCSVAANAQQMIFVPQKNGSLSSVPVASGLATGTEQLKKPGSGVATGYYTSVERIANLAKYDLAFKSCTSPPAAPYDSLVHLARSVDARSTRSCIAETLSERANCPSGYVEELGDIARAASRYRPLDQLLEYQIRRALKQNHCSDRSNDQSSQINLIKVAFEGSQSSKILDTPAGQYLVGMCRWMLAGEDAEYSETEFSLCEAFLTVAPAEKN